MFLLIAGLPAARAQEPAARESSKSPQHFFDHVRVTLEGGSTPFMAVQYAVRFIDGQAVAVQTKQYAHVPVYDNRVVAVVPEEALALMQKLDEDGIMDMAAASAEAPFALSWRIEVGFAGKANEFVVKGPALLDDQRFAQIIGTVKGFVEGHTGPSYYRDITVPEAELGLLNLRSYPPAEVFIDGVPLGRSSPVYGLELAPGVHSLVLRRDGLDRNYKFSIYKAQVTNLNLNLSKYGPVSKQPDEFGRRCIPSDFVALPRHILDMPRHPALPAGCLDPLGSIWLFLYGP